MISIIIPVYNVEFFLRGCLNSVIAQTEQDLEILLIDDGSTDSSGAICDEYRQKDNRIRVFHTENRGVAAARNLGLDEASGDYVGFVDSDDWIEPNMYELMLRSINESDADICVCSYTTEHKNSSDLCRNMSDAVLSREEAIKRSVDPEFDYTWNKLISKRLCKDVRFPLGRNFEDVAAVYRFFLNAKRTACISDALYHYRLREGSLITRHSMSDIIDFWDAYYDRSVFLSSMPEFENDMELADKFREQLANAASRTWRWIYTVSRSERDDDFLKNVSSYMRKNIPVFGEKDWSLYLKVSSFFARYPNDLSYFIMYAVNQLYRALIKKK